MINFHLPLNEVIFDFHDRIKSISQGYASFDYQVYDYFEGDLVKLNILVNSDTVDAFSNIVHRTRAETIGRRICNKLKENVFKPQYEEVWKSILESLLFPHSWVRLISSRLVGILLSNLDNSEFALTDYDIQTIAYRLLHQLGAPSISQDLGTQITKNLVLITMRWESNKVLYQFKQSPETEGGESTKYKYATDYLVSRVCSIIRQENNYKDSFVSKKSSVQFTAMLVQILSLEKLPAASEQILLALYNLTELNPNNSEEESELVNLSMECMQMIEKKLGTSEYTNIYTKVKQAVNLRRRERKTKRAQMAVTAPDIAARRKMKKHERSRDKRKHEKDDNGYYRSKKSRFT